MRWIRHRNNTSRTNTTLPRPVLERYDHTELIERDGLKEKHYVTPSDNC